MTIVPHHQSALNVDLRSFLRVLGDRGEYVSVTEPVKLRYELAAVLSRTDAGPAMRFDRLDDSQLPAVGNVVNSRERIAVALGVDVCDISEAISKSIANPVAPVLHDSGPCYDVDFANGLADLPIPTFFESETGPYITAGVILARDPRTGRANMSFARLKMIDSQRAMLGVSPRHHLGRMIQRAHDHNESLPFVVAIGTHPAVMLAACLYLGFGDDELECAGALLGRPVDVTTAGHADIAVPRDSEIVIEAVAHAHRRIPEGLVSEYHGHYHDYGEGYVVDIVRVSGRSDALFQVILPGLHNEHLVLGAVAIAAGLQHELSRLSSAVVDVAVPLTGAGRVSAVISVKDLRPGEAIRLMMASFAAVPLIKQVTVIDAPLDPWNAETVEWARTFRARPERDIHMFPQTMSDRSDPLARDGALTKMGIDATAKLGDREVGWQMATVPPAAMSRAAQILATAGLADARSTLTAGIYDDNS